MKRCLFGVCFFLNIIVMDDGSDEHIFNTLCNNLSPFLFNWFSSSIDSIQTELNLEILIQIEFQFKLHATSSNVLIQMKFTFQGIKSFSFITSLSLIMCSNAIPSGLWMRIMHLCRIQFFLLLNTHLCLILSLA
jgi:hypothetical protein